MAERVQKQGRKNWEKMTPEEKTKAVEDLKNAKNISEIAEKVGIIDDSHFSRDFKKYYNMPPAKYRQYFNSKNKI